MKIPRLTLAGFIIVLFGGVLSFCWDAIFNFILSKTVRLMPNSTLFKNWKDPDVLLYMDVYLFNWTNPEELFDEDFVPNVVELGPYTFRDQVSRVNVTWNKNKTVSYRRRSFWYFEPTKSGRPLSDNITMINPVALSAVHASRYNHYLTQVSISVALKLTGQKLWITRTAGELLFDGYEDGLLSFASKLPNLQGGTVYDKFGFFYTRNGSSTYEGTFNVETGEDDFNEIGKMREWNYKNKTDFFNAECGMVNGSDGSFFPPGNPKEKPLEMYANNFCRTLKFDYLEDIEVEGITSYRYVGTKRLMDTGDIDPDNWCFCSGECVPLGVINISTCARGAPVFISYPHLLHADPFYHKQIKGLQPSVEKHQFSITVEPITGFPVEVAGRFQFNFLLQPNDQIGMYNNVPRVLFPMLWCEEIFRITPEFASGMKLLLAVPTIGLCFSIGLVIIGLILLAVSYCKLKKQRGARENDHLAYSMVSTKPSEEEKTVKTNANNSTDHIKSDV